MNLHHLRLFCAVVEEQGFTRAAEKLHMSPQAVSLQVHQFVRESGLQLFSRSGRNVAITPEGLQAYEHGRAVLKAVEAMEQWIRQTQSPASQKVSVICSSTPGSYVVPTVLPAFDERFPHTEIDLRVMKSIEIPARLAVQSIVDFVVYINDLPADLVVEAIGRDELWLVTHHSHPLAHHRGAVSLPELARHVIVLRRGLCDIARHLLITLRGQGLSPQVNFVGSVEACRTAVLNSYGVTYLPRIAVQDAVATGALKRLDLPELEFARTVHIGVRRGHQLSEPARYLMELIRRRFQEAELAPLLSQPV